MSISVLGLSFDTHDAAKLAQFWAQASIAADTDTRPGAVLMFHKVSEGKTVKNRVHLDLQATDVVAEADRLTSLGAQQIRSLAENNNRWISLRDPEGNEFDLVASG